VKEQLEKFCQLVASGRNYTAAAVESGYANDRASASRRARRPEVAARIEALRAAMPPVIEPAAPEPSGAGLGASGGKPNRIAEFEQIRDEALKRGHTSAAATAQRDLTKAERVVEKVGDAQLSDAEMLAKAVAHSKATGARVEAWQFMRMMGMRDANGNIAGPLSPTTNGKLQRT
jgi:phage terminase small subunit